MSDNDVFEDKKLQKFHQDFLEHVEVGQKHREEFLALVERLDAGEDERRANSEELKKLTENTAALVLAWKDGQSVVRVMSSISKVAKWLTGLAVFGTAATYLLDKFKP